MAKSCGEHLNTLIGNLLEYSKLKAKKIEIAKNAIDLKHNVQRIIKMNYLKS
jgi:signal transduction histidine kinase